MGTTNYRNRLQGAGPSASSGSRRRRRQSHAEYQRDRGSLASGGARQMTDTAPKMPHNLQAERSVLGAILLDDSALVPAMQRLAPEDFLLSQHVHVFSHMVELHRKGVAIDSTTLVYELQRAGDLEAAGGVSYIAQLPDGLPRATNVAHYAEIVKDDS